MRRRQFLPPIAVMFFTLALGITPVIAGDLEARLNKASEMFFIVEEEGTLDQALNMVFETAPEANREKLRQLLDGHLDRNALYAE